MSGLAKQLTDLDIQDRIDEVGGQVRSGNQNIQEGVHDLAKQLTDIDSAVEDRVNEVGHQLRSGTQQIEEGVNGLAKQLATYQQQIVAVINHVPHGVSEMTFVVIPPTGIPIPISFSYCNTSEVSRSYVHSLILSLFVKDLSRILDSHLHGRREIGRLGGHWYIAQPEDDPRTVIDFESLPAVARSGRVMAINVITMQCRLRPKAKVKTATGSLYPVMQELSWTDVFLGLPPCRSSLRQFKFERVVCKCIDETRIFDTNNFPVVAHFMETKNSKTFTRSSIRVQYTGNLREFQGRSCFYMLITWQCS